MVPVVPLGTVLLVSVELLGEPLTGAEIGALALTNDLDPVDLMVPVVPLGTDGLANPDVPVLLLTFVWAPGVPDSPAAPTVPERVVPVLPEHPTGVWLLLCTTAAFDATGPAEVMKKARGQRRWHPTSSKTRV